MLCFPFPGATTALSTYTYVSTQSTTTAGGYGTFTTDATGKYTGWFGVVPTNNPARFSARPARCSTLP